MVISIPEVLDSARRLSDGGRYRAAIDLLSDANRAHPDPAVELALVKLRQDAFTAEPAAAPSHRPEPISATPPPVAELNELSPDDLDIESLRAGMEQHGCVLVRGLVPPDTVRRMVEGIDRALAACDEGLGGAPAEQTAPWFVPFEPPPGQFRVAGRRKWMRASGGVWTVDSPRMLFELTEMIRELGIDTLVGEYLGEPPALSANKCNLRRASAGNCGDWHQDGAFLPGATRSMNLWLALSDCGSNAPTMDIVPRRLDELVVTGTEGTYFDWAVAPDKAAEAAGDVPIIRPSFRAGDAMLFDHLFLHRTAADPEMPDDRYAMETWFFAPSTYPEGQIPIVL